MTRLLASLLLVLGSPGLAPYAAFAQTVRVGAPAAPIAPVVLPAALPGAAAPALAPNLSPALTRVSLTPMVVQPVLKTPRLLSLSPRSGERAGVRGSAELAAAAASSDSPAVSRSPLPIEMAQEVRVLGRPTKISTEVRALKELFRTAAPGAEPPAAWSTPEVTPRPGLTLAPPKAEPPQGPRVAPEVPGPKPRGFLGLSNAAALFIAALLIQQVGVEAWAAAWAKWVQAAYGLDAFALITTSSMLVSLAAGFAGGWLGDRIGQKWSYVLSTLATAALATATLFIAGPGGMVAAIVALTAMRTLTASAGRTVEQTIPIALTHGDAQQLQRYNSISQFILETAGIAVPLLIHTLLGVFGAVGTMAIHPITAVAAAAMVFFLVKIPEDVRRPAAPAAETPPADPAPKDPRVLKVASLGYPVFVLINMMLYGVLAISYGNFVFPGVDAASQAAAAGLAGKIVGLYSLGSLFSALALTGLLPKFWAWLKGKLGRPGAPAAGPEDEIRATAKWTLWAAVGLLGFVPFIWANPLWAALAMIPFGFTNIMGQLRLLSLIQSNVPAERKGKVMGTIRTVSTLLATAGIYGFTQLTKHFPGSPMPFWILLGALAVVAAYYAWLALKLRGLVAKGRG
ncbi:MAG: MFS transporter [Elusimicrobia bacterium]|nr:MFS transporter [Elusimicrobiota bacterium]